MRHFRRIETQQSESALDAEADGEACEDGSDAHHSAKHPSQYRRRQFDDASDDAYRQFGAVVDKPSNITPIT